MRRSRHRSFNPRAGDHEPLSFQLTAITGMMMRNVAVPVSASRHVSVRYGYGATTDVDHLVAEEQTAHGHAEPTACWWDREAAVPQTPRSDRDPGSQGARRLSPGATGAGEELPEDLRGDGCPAVEGLRLDAGNAAGHAEDGPRPDPGSHDGALRGGVTTPPGGVPHPYRRHHRVRVP